MAEQLPESNLPPTSADEPLTYGAVLRGLHELPASHPRRLIAPHVERLLAARTGDETTPPAVDELRPTPGEADDLVLVYEPELGDDERSQLDAAETEAPPAHDITWLIKTQREVNHLRWHERTPTLADEHSEAIFSADTVLARGDYSPAQLATYIHEALVGEEIEAKIDQQRTGRLTYDYQNVYWALEKVPADKLRAVYQSPELAAGLQHLYVQSQSSHDVGKAVHHFQRIYGLPDILDVYIRPELRQHDPIVQAVLDKRNSGVAAAEKLVFPEAWPEGLNPTMETIAKRDWADRYLKLAVGLPDKQRDELLFATYSQTTNAQTGMVNSRALRDMIQSVYLNTRQLSQQDMRQLRERAGIINLANYIPGQLQRMAAFLNGDPALLDHLQRGDTTVVLTDATGDFNGALRTTAVEFDQGTERTLLFEVNQPSDFYRHLLTVAKFNIKPSTIVVAAHGMPGAIDFGQGKQHFTLINEGRAPGVRQTRSPVHLTEATGLERVAGKLMRDSHGLDDNPDAKGRRRIIFKSCSVARSIPVSRYFTAASQVANGGAENGVSGSVRIETIDYDEIEESLAATVTKQAAHPRLDVYAGEHLLAVERTPAGIQFRRPVVASGTERWEPFEATHYRLDTDGNLIEDRVAEVILRPSPTAALAPPEETTHA